MAKQIIRHELVEIVIPSGSTLTRFQFPDIPNLRNSMIWGLQVYTVDQVFQSPLSQNALLSHTNVLHRSFVTLVNYGGKEFLKQAPSIIFNTINFNLNVSTNAFETDIKSFVGQKVNYPKSYIEFTASPSGLANLSYLVSVYYSLPIEEEKKESGYSFGQRR
jgi:hypothetical protein